MSAGSHDPWNHGIWIWISPDLNLAPLAAFLRGFFCQAQRAQATLGHRFQRASVEVFLSFLAEMRGLGCFCLCVTGFEKMCTRYRPRDSVIACRPCVNMNRQCLCCGRRKEFEYMHLFTDIYRYIQHKSNRGTLKQCVVYRLRQKYSLRNSR